MPESGKKSKPVNRAPTIDVAVSATAADASREQISAPTTAEIVPRRESASAAVVRLKEIELELLEKANVVVQDAMAFDELDELAKEPPAEWVEKYGEAEAFRRFRRVRAGQSSGAFAPIGVKVATNIMTSLIKKSKEEDKSPTINVQVAHMPIAVNYPSLKVDK